MLPANLISALQVLSRSDKPLIAAAIDPPNPALKLEVGQELQATVQSKVTEGLFKVQVAGQTLQMRLPDNIQSGDVLKLQVIAINPRITFSMVASTNPLSTPEQIGSTARILANLADLPIERPVVQQLGNKAIWQAGQREPDAKLLAGGLREALGKSGLFYESHQAQWVRGERSINQLLEEPQNVLTGKSLLPTAPNQQAASTVSGQAVSNINPSLVKPAFQTVQESLQANGLLNAKTGPEQTALIINSAYGKPDAQRMQESLQDSRLPISSKPDGESSSSTAGTGQQVPPDKTSSATQAQANVQVASKSAGDDALPIVKELLPLVQQQLHTLEHHHLVWMGQVWPGQEMQWEIQGEPEHHAQQQDERQWSTEMELTLPNLGNVRARLVFAESGVRLTLHAADSTTAELFDHALPTLANSLADAGIPLTASVVEKQ